MFSLFHCSFPVSFVRFPVFPFSCLLFLALPSCLFSAPAQLCYTLICFSADGKKRSTAAPPTGSGGRQQKKEGGTSAPQAEERISITPKKDDNAGPPKSAPPKREEGACKQQHPKGGEEDYHSPFVSQKQIHSLIAVAWFGGCSVVCVCFNVFAFLGTTRAKKKETSSENDVDPDLGEIQSIWHVLYAALFLTRTSTCILNKHCDSPKCGSGNQVSLN